MAVSIERAAECIGRSVLHENKNVRGVVDHVTAHDVWVKTTDGDVIPCIPAHLSWISTLSKPMAQAITRDWDDFDGAQVRYASELYVSDPDDDLLPGLGVLYTPDLANDDDRNHPLYLVARHVQRVYIVRPTALPDTAWEIEEVLGWKTA